MILTVLNIVLAIAWVALLTLPIANWWKERKAREESHRVYKEAWASLYKEMPCVICGRGVEVKLAGERPYYVLAAQCSKGHDEDYSIKTPLPIPTECLDLKPVVVYAGPRMPQ